MAKKRLTLADNLKKAAQETFRRLDRDSIDSVIDKSNSKNNLQQNEADKGHLTHTQPAPNLTLTQPSPNPNLHLTCTQPTPNPHLTPYAPNLHLTHTQPTPNLHLTPSKLDESHTTILDKVNNKKMSFLAYCLHALESNPNHIIQTRFISQDIDIPLNTVRKYTQSLKKQGYYGIKSIRTSDAQGFRVEWIMPKIIEIIHMIPEQYPTYTQPYTELNKTQLTQPTPNPHLTVQNIPNLHLTHAQPPNNIPKNECLNIHSFKNNRVDPNTLKQCWPHLTNEGLSINHITDLITHMELKQLDPERIIESMNRIDFEIQNTNGQIIDSKGKQVTNIIGLFLYSMRTYGIYHKPKGYLTPEEIERNEEIEVLKNLERMREEKKQVQSKLDEQDYANWLNKLTDEERHKFAKKSAYAGPVSAQLHRYWNDYVKAKT